MRGGRWSTLGTAILLLGPVGCVPIEARPILLELTTSTWFVLFGTEPSSGDTVVSGIFPREAAILSNIALTDVGVLGWKEQPPGLSGALDRPGKIASGCEPALPRPDEAIQIDGRALKDIPAIGGPWLDEGSCPPLPPGIAVEDGCALTPCAIEVMSQSGCGFTGTLDRANCSLSSAVEGRINNLGRICAVLKAAECRPDPGADNISICRAEQKECRLSVLDAIEPIQFERRPLLTHGARLLPPVASRLEPDGTPRVREHLVEHLVDGMSLGYASDLAVLGDRLITLEHDQPLLAFGCTSSDAPDRLRIYDLDLQLVKSATISPCATRLAATSTAGFYVLHRGQAPTIALHAPDGALIRERPLLNNGACAQQGYAPIGAARAGRTLYVVLTRTDINQFGFLYARLDAELEAEGSCVALQNPIEPRLRTIVDFQLLKSGKPIIADSRANVLATFNVDGSDVRVFRARSGLDGADMGPLLEIDDGIVAATLPSRQASVQFWDFRGHTFPEDFPPAHQPKWGESPLGLGPHSDARLLVTLWSPLGSAEVSASVSLIDRSTRRFERRGASLGPGLPSRIVADPRGGSLVLMPWTGEVVRVLPE